MRGPDGIVLGDEVVDEGEVQAVVGVGDAGERDAVPVDGFLFAVNGLIVENPFGKFQGGGEQVDGNAVQVGLAGDARGSGGADGLVVGGEGQRAQAPGILRQTPGFRFPAGAVADSRFPLTLSCRRI